MNSTLCVIQLGRNTSVTRGDGSIRRRSVSHRWPLGWIIIICSRRTPSCFRWWNVDFPPSSHLVQPLLSDTLSEVDVLVLWFATLSENIIWPYCSSVHWLGIIVRGLRNTRILCREILRKFMVSNSNALIFCWHASSTFFVIHKHLYPWHIIHFHWYRVCHTLFNQN